MKRNILLLTLFVGLLACGQTVMAQNSTKQIAQFNHVMKGLKLEDQCYMHQEENGNKQDKT